MKAGKMRRFQLVVIQYYVLSGLITVFTMLVIISEYVIVQHSNFVGLNMGNYSSCSYINSKSNYLFFNTSWPLKEYSCLAFSFQKLYIH
jgi:hypothetical protein